MCYGFVAPLAGRLEQHVQDEGNYEQCIKAGLVALYLLFILFAYYILKPISRALFLTSFDIEKLPYLMIMIAVIMVMIGMIMVMMVLLVLVGHKSLPQLRIEHRREWTSIRALG